MQHEPASIATFVFMAASAAWRRLRGGGLAERSKAHAWKACRGATPSRVRTPQPPPRNQVIHLRIRPGGCPRSGLVRSRRIEPDRLTTRTRRELEVPHGHPAAAPRPTGSRPTAQPALLRDLLRVRVGWRPPLPGRLAGGGLLGTGAPSRPLRGGASRGSSTTHRPRPATVLALLHEALSELLDLATVLWLAGLFLDLLGELLALGALGEILGPLEE